MKITIKQNIINEQLNNVIKGISNKNIIPILNCIKLSLTEKGLYLISTDNEISIKGFIPADKIESITEYGDIVVSGRLLHEIIKKLSGDIINIEELIDSKLSVYTNKSSFTLNCNNVSEYPDVDIEEKENPIFINKRVFKNIVNQTIFAASTQESRPVLTGINFNFTNNKLICTATDSYRLARKEITLNNNIGENYNIIIPTKNLNDLIRMCNEDENDIELHIFENKIIFKFDNLILLSRIINGVYPDTSKLIPTEFTLEIKTNLRELYNSIDRASLLTSESEKNTVRLESKGTHANITSNKPEIGNVEEIITIESNSNENIKIAFSSKYMLDALKSMNCEEIILKFNGDIKPIIIKNVENDDTLQLILPIRTY